MKSMFCGMFSVPIDPSCSLLLMPALYEALNEGSTLKLYSDLHVE